MKSEKDIDINELYQSFRKPLYRFISYKVSDTYSAEEILNDVFFKASTSIESLKEKTKLQSWLFKIASNLIIDYYRKRKDKYVDINDYESVGEELQDETVFDELNCCVENYINKLPKQYADSLKAVYFDELTQKEYAEHNNIKLSTVKSQVKRGKESMKSFFESCCTFEKDKFDNMVQCKSNDTSCRGC